MHFCSWLAGNGCRNAAFSPQTRVSRIALDATLMQWRAGTRLDRLLYGICNWTCGLLIAECSIQVRSSKISKPIDKASNATLLSKYNTSPTSNAKYGSVEAKIDRRGTQRNTTP